MSSTRRLLLVDQCLRDTTGHHLFYNRALAVAAKELGLQASVWAGTDFPTELMSSVETRAVFRRDWRAAPPAWAIGIPRILDLLEGISRWSFERDLHRAFRNIQISSRDVIFGQMITPRHLTAWLNWMRSIPSPCAPILAVHLAYDPSRFLHHQQLARSLRKFQGDPRKANLLPITDSSRLAAAYSTILDCEIPILPHVIGNAISELNPPPPGEKPVFGVLGSPRADKGFAEVVQVILSLSLNPAPPQFLVQVHDPDDTSALWVARLREAKLPNVELVDRCLDSDSEYAQLFSRVAVFLLPYHLRVYGFRTSGIFCEALASGRPVIVSGGSWMDEKAGEKAACLRVSERDPLSLSSAISSMASRYREMSARAHQMAPVYREEFSAREFVSRLLSLVHQHA